MPIAFSESTIYDPYDAYLFDIGNNRQGYDKFNDKIKNLPEKFQDFIFDTVPADFIKDRISIPLDLDENQSREAAKIVLEILLADWYLGDAVNQIKQRLGVDEQKARAVAGLIVSELLAPILEDLKKIHIEKFAKNLSPQTQQPNNDRVVDLKNQ